MSANCQLIVTADILYLAFKNNNSNDNSNEFY